MTVEKTAEQALCHLFFHFCHKDGVFDKKEIDFIAAQFVSLDLNHELDFKKEVVRYTEDRQQFSTDSDYLQDLVSIIKPANTLAVFSWCTEICLSDDLITMEEQGLLDNLAAALDIDAGQKDTIKAVMIERKVVQLNKIV